MKPKDELQQDAGLVRDIEALCAIDFPADDTERNGRDVFFKKDYAEITESRLEVQHVRRIHEAVCAMKFPTANALGLRRAAMLFLGRSHNLNKYKTVKMPAIALPKPSTP